MCMARIGAAHGIRGWLWAQSYASDDGIYSTACGWRLKLAGAQQWEPAAIEDSRPASGSLQIKLVGCDDRTDAEALRGSELGLPRKELPELPDGQYYWHDLIGASVRNREDEELGRVREVLPMPANGVLVAVRDGRENLIPLTDTHVVSVDVRAGDVVVDWPANF